MGPEQDLLKPTGRADLLRRVSSGEFDWIHMGTPCTTFCRFFTMFNRRCTQTAENPSGLGKFNKEQACNALVALSCRVASAAMKVGTWWTVENPRSSLLLASPCMQPLLQRPGVGNAFLV